MKHLLIGLGVLLMIFVAAALLAPSFVDWNRYKGEIARRVEEATGRRLTIDGAIALALLPTPRISVSDVRVAGLPGSVGPELLRLKALEAHIAFAALLAGRVQIESLALIEPQLELERLADGRGRRFTAPALLVAARPGHDRERRCHLPRRQIGKDLVGRPNLRRAQRGLPARPFPRPRPRARRQAAAHHRRLP